MVDKWKIKPDVAGATFMAAGGSTPELVTSFIAQYANSDVGFSTIVGSAVFNVLFVIGLCGYYAKEEMKLTWWPLFRDCTYYIMSLGVLCAFSWNQEMELEQAIILFGLYIVYCIIMYYNEKLQALVDGRLRRAAKQVMPAEALSEADKSQAGETDASDSPTVSDTAKKVPEGDAVDNSPEMTPEAGPEVTPEVQKVEEEENANGDGKEGNGDGGDGEEEEDEHFMTKPEGLKEQIMWYLALPIYGPLYVITPEPSESKFMYTFVTSLCWIFCFSYPLVWWVEILGDMIFRGNRSASIIMGFTILAAGTSIPDLVSSVAVAKMGEGDMAVSSSIGSNIFDILVGLPVPWICNYLYRHLIKDPDFHGVRIDAPYAPFYVMLLLFMVMLTMTSIHVQGWRLNWKLGAMMAMLYGLFLLIACTVELSSPCGLIFHAATKRDCESR
jgi:K+-dependent Na+/Ca+ exchanger-like protein